MTCTTLFCFFFQAEDGIRDLTVTGVQTCALPISAASVPTYVSLPTLPLPPLFITTTQQASAYELERSEEHTSELQSQSNLVCRLLLEKKKNGEGHEADGSSEPSPQADSRCSRRPT